MRAARLCNGRCNECGAFRRSRAHEGASDLFGCFACCVRFQTHINLSCHFGDGNFEASIPHTVLKKSAKCVKVSRPGGSGSPINVTVCKSAEIPNLRFSLNGWCHPATASRASQPVPFEGLCEVYSVATPPAQNASTVQFRGTTIPIERGHHIAAGPIWHLDEPESRSAKPRQLELALPIQDRYLSDGLAHHAKLKRHPNSCRCRYIPERGQGWRALNRLALVMPYRCMRQL
jgi:hypothetical protein